MITENKKLEAAATEGLVAQTNSTNNLNISFLPKVIDENVSLLSQLSTKVKEAQTAAEQAESKAKTAAAEKTRFGHHKSAIEALQESNIATAEAQTALVTAQRVSFDFQQTSSQIS